jgi:CMP-N-acetylneuraminic acid synthetase
MKATCFIPAKGTSERLLGKNCLKCDGVPLVGRAVALARQSKRFSKIVVSTESREVYEAAGNGAVWHDRPGSLSLATSSVWDAVHHYGKPETEYIVLLHPTSPCLRANTIRNALDNLEILGESCDALVSVSISNPFSWCCVEKPNFSDAKRTQDCLTRLELNNGLFVAKWEKLYEVKNGFDLNWLPFTIWDKTETIDIDEEDDLIIAEAILQWRQKNEVT